MSVFCRTEPSPLYGQQPPPPGYERAYGGQAQMMGEMTQSAVMILAFSLFFSFIVLTVQFNSLKLPTLILVSVPFCMAGMAGLLLFTYALLLQKTEQLSVRDAVLKAATIRLRPIVMVSMAILIGLMPLALALEAGGEMLQPMAIAAIGGLAMEMLVSLFLMPCLYLMANAQKNDGGFEVQPGANSVNKGG